MSAKEQAENAALRTGDASESLVLVNEKLEGQGAQRGLDAYWYSPGARRRWKLRLLLNRLITPPSDQV